MEQRADPCSELRQRVPQNHGCQPCGWGERCCHPSCQSCRHRAGVIPEEEQNGAAKVSLPIGGLATVTGLGRGGAHHPGAEGEALWGGGSKHRQHT